MSYQTILVENDTTTEIVLQEYGVYHVLTGSVSFLGLTDTPNSYAGAANMTVTVNSAGNGLTFTPAGAGAVDSVFGRTGAVTAEQNDYSMFYTQPGENVSLFANDANYVSTGENVSLFANDAGYITLADIPATGVISVDGRTGIVTLNDLYATTAQGLLADTALQSVADDLAPSLSGDLFASDYGISVRDSQSFDTLFKIKNYDTPNKTYMAFGTILSADTGLGYPLVNAVQVLSDMYIMNVNNAMKESAINIDYGNRNYLRLSGNTYNLNMNNKSISGLNGLSFFNTAAQIVPENALTPGSNGIIMVSDSFKFFSSEIQFTASYPTSALAGTAGKVLTSDGLGNITFENIPSGSVTSVDGRTGVVTLNDLYASSAQGALADTALQSGDNVSELTNDAGYITIADIPVNVSSFNGRSGAVTPLAADYSSFYASAAQGSLASSAIQPGNNISLLNNNSGFITAAQVPADAVPSVFGRTGAITAQSSDYASFYATTAQGSLANTAVQPDNANVNSLGEKILALGNVSGSRTIIPANNSYMTATATGNTTYTTSTSGMDAGYAFSWTVELTNGGAFTTVFSGVLWSGGTMPALTAAGRDLILFVYNGVNIIGSVLQDVK